MTHNNKYVEKLLRMHNKIKGGRPIDKYKLDLIKRANLLFAKIKGQKNVCPSCYF